MAHEVEQTSLQLPTLVVGPMDVTRLQRELAALEDFMQQSAIRSPGKALALPRTSRMFEEFSTLNKLNLLTPADRQQMKAFLDILKKDVPVIHISFAVDPSSAFVSKLITWFRNNVHPQLLLRIGLQPTIAAGCVVRTENHIFDFSLRQRFTAQRELLIDKLRDTA